MTVPQLQPLDVPWQINPSVPLLGFASKNFEGINHGYVTFDACLGEATQLSKQFGQYKQVAVNLDTIVWAKLYPRFSVDDSSRLKNYDWSRIPEFATRRAPSRDMSGVFTISGTQPGSVQAREHI
jgi:hypothetical protein